MMKSGFLKHLLLVVLAALAIGVHADTPSGQFGLVYGLSIPDADNTKTFHMWGVKGDAFLNSVFSLGGYYYNSDRSGQTSGYEFWYNLTGVQGAYHFPSNDGDTFIGVRLGITKLQQNPSGVEATFSPYHYGVITGYDHYFSDYFSIGFEGSYLHVLPGRAYNGGTAYDEPSFNIFSFLLTTQVRF